MEECQRPCYHHHRLSRWVSMLNVMNPSEVLGHHAGRAKSNTFRLSLDGGVSTTMLSSSPTVAMGQHAGCDEPIGGIAKMVHLKDFVDGKRRYLAIVDREDDLPKSGTCLAVRPSLLRPGNKADSLVNSQNFRKSMSTVIKLDNMDAYVLHNMMPDRDATNDKPPLLGRSIRSISYNAPVKRKRYTGAPPKSTHNPSGKLADPPSEWSKFFKDVEARRVIHEGSGAKGSMSRIWLPVFSLDWHKLKTDKFHGWWTTVTIKDLRHKLTNFCSAVEVNPHDEARDAHRSADGHASRHEGTGDNVCAAPPRRLHLTGVLDEVEGEDKSTSDAESEINFKHQRGRRSKKPRTADLEGDETDFRNAFENIPIPSDIPIDLNQMGASFNIDDAMIGEATEPLNVLTDRPNPGKGKDIHMERDLVERSNSASPVQTHHSVDGPSTFEINAKTLCIPLDAKGIPRAPSHGDAAPAPPISTIRVTPASQGIFTSAIRILGNEYLTLLKQTPFDKVSERHGEAPQVYKAIRVMHGDPEPLKCKVDEYVWAVKSHLALKASLSDRRRSDQVEEERLAIEKELRLAESRLEEEGAALKKKEDELLKELEDVRQRIDQVANDLDDNRNSLTTLEATVHTTKRRVEELEAVPVCNAEEMELFEEQERKLLEFQSSLDIEWMV
ncbi:E3 ubiquitin-protein ligase TRIM71 [Bienertia sinuspersici]